MDTDPILPPTAPLRPARRFWAFAVLALVLVAGGAACSSDEGSDDGATTTTEAAADGADADADPQDDGQDDESGDEGDGGTDDDAVDDGEGDTDEDGDGGGSGGDLGSAIVGTWSAEAADLYGANAEDPADAGGFTCEGSIQLEFGADGTFLQSGDPACGVDGQTVTTAISTEGTYRVEGDQVIVVEATDEGDGDGLQAGEEATVSVSGDTMTVSFDDPDLGTITQTWTRVG